MHPGITTGATLGFSAKTDYGLVALMELAGEYLSGGVLQVAEIAGRQAIPERYLEQMMTSLRRAGILRSIRGPRGGYQLARSPSQLTVAEVVACLEGEVSTRDGSSRNSPEFQALDGLSAALDRQREERLAAITLQDLLEQRDQHLEAQAMYFI
jgi:Rrf2 family protein